MVKLRTALVLLLCASVGVHAGVKLKDLVKMTPQGGLVNTWLYEKVVVEAGENRTVLCINTTEATDPCTNTIDMPAGETDISFGLLPSDDVSIKDGGTSAMKVTVTPKAGSSGIMASNSRAADLLNHDKDPMKTIIAGGKLKSVSYAVYASVRIAKEVEITYDKWRQWKEGCTKKFWNGAKNKVDRKPCDKRDYNHVVHEGKISYFKLSLCYGVSFKATDGTLTTQGSKCSSVKSFRVDYCRPSWIVAKDRRNGKSKTWKKAGEHPCKGSVLNALQQTSSMRV